ncbi:UNVERIFIED_CONTAM: hypothetical protein GTU68_063293 [Idotea baltica]|nr:hypothetical protein [Idotea baltica]
MVKRRGGKKNIIYKTSEEIELLRHSNILVSKTHAAVVPFIKPGVKTSRLDEIGEQFILDNNAKPGFKGLYGCPSTLLISVNEAVVHGLPSDREIKEGDVVSIDIGVLANDFYGDSAYTYVVGEVPEDVMQLMVVTKDALYKGIEQAVTGKRIGDIAFAIQAYTEKKHGYGVVRDLVGHGVGRSLHEQPEVPNFGKRGKGIKLLSGLSIAIEPMINMGTKDVMQNADGWTIVTRDGKPSAHYEHSVVVQPNKADILSTFEFTEEAIRKNPELQEVICEYDKLI